MFQTVKLPPNPLHRFCFPSIPPVTLVKSIITALDEQLSQVIMVPFYTQFGPLLKILPSFVRDLLQWVRFDQSISVSLFLTF
jgi:hypothetical protein